MRKIVMPGFHTPLPAQNKEVKNKTPIAAPKTPKKKVKKEELKGLVGAIIKEKIPEKPKIKKPSVKEETPESKRAEYVRIQDSLIKEWLSARSLTLEKTKDDGEFKVIGSNRKVMGEAIKTLDGGIDIQLYRECWPLGYKLAWQLGTPARIKTLKQDQMLNRFCGTELRWGFDNIIEGGDFIGSILRFSDGSLQINIIRGDPARHGEYKFECFKGIGD